MLESRTMHASLSLSLYYLGSSDPRNVVVVSIAMETEGRPDVVIDLSSAAAVEALKTQTMTIKEGCEYRLKVQFRYV